MIKTDMPSQKISPADLNEPQPLTSTPSNEPATSAPLTLGSGAAHQLPPQGPRPLFQANVPIVKPFGKGSGTRK